MPRDPSKPPGFYCDAQRPNQPKGTLCGQRAGHGTSHPKVGHCSRHGGNTDSHVRAAATELARQACETLGVPLDIHPAEALVREVCETAGNVEFYRSLVQELQTHPDPDVYVQPTENEDEGHWERGAPGIYGRTYHVSGLPTGDAKPHILVALYNEERDRLVKATTAALKAGVDARRVKLAEQEMVLVADAFRGFAVALGLDPAEQRVREAFRAQLKLISGGRAA